MEHLKLFSARLNIPRLIRACEEQHHWRELVFLYVAYDEYDNAALVMMAHSPAAWEHVQFKDVAVKARPRTGRRGDRHVQWRCVWSAALAGQLRAVGVRILQHHRMV